MSEPTYTIEVKSRMTEPEYRAIQDFFRAGIRQLPPPDDPIVREIPTETGTVEITIRMNQLYD